MKYGILALCAALSLFAAGCGSQMGTVDGSATPEVHEPVFFQAATRPEDKYGLRVLRGTTWEVQRPSKNGFALLVGATFSPVVFVHDGKIPEMTFRVVEQINGEWPVINPIGFNVWRIDRPGIYSVSFFEHTSATGGTEKPIPLVVKPEKIRLDDPKTGTEVYCRPDGDYAVVLNSSVIASLPTGTYGGMCIPPDDAPGGKPWCVFGGAANPIHLPTTGWYRFVALADNGSVHSEPVWLLVYDPVHPFATVPAKPAVP